LLAPIRDGLFELVIGARSTRMDPGSLTATQRYGNVFATRLMNAIHHTVYTDLGPFRAITWRALLQIGMADPDYGWTIEMQIKASRHGIALREVDVQNHARIAGRSKVSGTVRGVVGAGNKIIRTILRYSR
jgi:hypothetical protein